ncbi:MAG: bifunctional phosphoribosylaminoimidazolecarboxamide formyltransferase/IMP cyclohydrolase [Liquorilactobacillus nagelii]|jgi:phosphoribosylaminoimidazolecarboxamide formyltransferase/IMP cyclohydrolase|uniref:bifunctional phosphoribosylaminoimidazolecarboxamide formyltransferase/IMP cyclohydrolase n=1 Tax=Liquorilactobacillus nagelii TaxID=82688 RepID=UPI00242C3450|nr:bifunctional phosphoribosylaminoimidazolecarboxamide formyltransferase/IMP cyclohydrolase [Liquorilactobacillus nagelii]MCI1634368.1 bifunctional phosphoribosylaminoimidazolecarboxamide formyltransferase/IMP cyclohydrolase [Liquorilactobacillus nagelii]
MRRALLSVSDKSNLIPFAKKLIEHQFEIISTGGTRQVLNDAGVKTISVEDVTGFPEILDGRVKTLNPFIHGGLLGRRELPEHRRVMKKLGIHPIDLVCVNLYPFKQTILKPGVKLADAIENIDIGGPSMLRSAAKNYRDVTVVVDSTDYQLISEQLDQQDEVDLTTRAQLAAKAFRHTAAYDALIANYLSEQVKVVAPEKLTLTYELEETMRYGENSHQKAWFYRDALPNKKYSITNAQQLHGKKLSYNNIKDADAAIRIAREFSKPTVVALKHMNPCGIGQADKLETAWDRAYAADSISIFGGVIVLNRKVDLATATKMHKLFLEIIIAPEFDPAAYDMLAKKKNLRILQLDFTAKDEPAKKETVSIMGGLLMQEQDVLAENPHSWQVVTKTTPTDQQLANLLFAWKTVKHTKSNAIVVANGQQTLGIGAGQPNRIDSTKIAIKNAGEQIDEQTVLASDAFFPMDDCVQYAAEHGIKAIVQPGGSIRDQDSIAMADKYGIAMVTTGIRHFRH